jgi:hypothetical protein
MNETHYRAAPQAKTMLQILFFLTDLLLCLVTITLFSGGSILNILRISGIYLLLWIGVGIVYVPMYIDHIRITVTDRTVTVDSGVFFIRSRSLLLRALQMTAFLEIVPSRYTGMHFLSLHAYGGSLILPFLRRKDAQALHTFFNAYLSSRPSDDHGNKTEASHAS